MSADALAPVTLGRTGLSITRLAMGTAPLASVFWDNDAPTAIAAVQRALEAGIGLFDTAPLYGLGEAEERLGRGLGSMSPRPDVAIATKAGRTLRDGADGRAIDFDFSYEATRRSLAGSLERLGVDHVDIVHIHDPDDHRREALEGTYRALHELRAEGAISAVSLGTNRVDTAAFFVAEADLDCVLVAGRYTLLDRRAADVHDECRRRGIAVLAAGVFNSGVLADPVDGAWYDYAPAPPAVLERARTLADMCARHDVALRTAALQFPLTHPAVAAVVVGMSDATQVDENIAALATPVPDALWDDLTPLA